jgi:hypothetical protein
MPVIEQGFTHAHENDIGQFVPVYIFALAVDQYHFIEDLIELQIPFLFNVSGGTEPATQAASYL